MVSESITSDIRDWLVEHQRDGSAEQVLTAHRSAGAVVGIGQAFDLAEQVRAELHGAGPLEEHLLRPGVTDVLVNSTEAVWVDDGAALMRFPSPFADDLAVRRMGQRLAAAVGRRLDDAVPFVDARLPDGSRFHAVLAPLARPGTLLSIRIPARRRFSIADLVAAGALPELGAPWLEAVIRAKLSFLISGGTGCGKTTVLAALLALTDPGERLLLLEDSAELSVEHDHVCALEARPANIEGSGRIALQDLLRQSLRMRPDRIVVGEVRGAEVVDLLGALNTGHEGGCGTVHANDATAVPARLEALAMTGGIDRATVHSQMAAGLDLVVHLERRAGQRRVAGVGSVELNDVGLCRVRPLLRFDADRVVLRDPHHPVLARLAESLP